MHQTHGNGSFANGRSHPLEASRADIAHGEYPWEAAPEHQRRTGKRLRWTPIWFHSQRQIASGEDKAFSSRATEPRSQLVLGEAGFETEKP